MVQKTSKAGDFTGKKLELPSQNESKKIMKKSASMKLSDVDDVASRSGKKLISNSSPKLEGRTTTVTVMKSKAIELSDVDGLISLPQMGSLSQPGKPPTPMAVEVGVLSKSRESKASPNYMKSTSCFDARKDSKKARGSSNASPSYMKSASCSGARKDSICDQNQAGRSLKNSKPDQYGMRLARSSSLKLGRNLTKSASFKQTGSLNKSLPKAAALCSDIHAQRATCSSLLKDSKSPSYVMLNSGATESNGTSVMKVCTYKYCSLNGHHHAVVPPLKSFVYARRQSLKNQKSVKLKEHEDGTEGKRWAGSDVRVGEGVDFCVDIYDNGKEEVAELTLDGADHENGDGLKYIEKASDDLEGEETDAADGVEAESETEKVSGNCCDGSVEAEDENSFEEENGESPLLATSSAEGTFEAENDEELYDSIWEAYEMELQEFEFIEARLDDQVYISVAAEDKIAEKENVEDEHSYANCADDALIELNEENYDQKENKDELLEYRASEMDQEHIQQDQYVYVLTDSDAESENRTSDGDGDHEGSLSADKVNRNEDEEHDVTEKSEGNDVFVSPDNAEGSCDADTYDDSTINISTSSKAENASFEDKMTSNQEHSETSNCLMKITKCKAAEDSDGQKGFNPQEPNYLPLEPEAKGEQVDLRHQDIEERKNSEEWMVDYALQKTVNQLAPVKRKKVELLVEAFETVAPTSKPDRRARRASFPLANTRSIQACN
ncbi:unnamed protein product [Rhodiola kirilowii]